MFDENFILQLANLIVEFYGTNNEERRKEINEILVALPKSENGFIVAFHLLDSKFPPIVQHYGACVLYETINDSWEYCSSKQEIVERLKNILIEKLTMGAHMQNQSITNKLSSSLASFILYCIPDIWPDPFGDIATLWSGQPELLLRVLTEIAAEFHRVRLPLRQRGVVKSILKQTIPNLIKIIEIVLNGENIPPSLKNAAVECAEQWLKLPGNDLAEWHSHLHLILLNIADDWTAMEQIFTTIANHPDIQVMGNLAYDLSCHIVKRVLPYILSQLSVDPFNSCSEELSLLIRSLADFTVVTIKQVLIKCDEQSEYGVFNEFCVFFATISNWPGHYPLDENISEAPQIFWNSLKDEFFLCSERKKYYLKGLEICRPYIAQCLETVIDKITYPNNEEYQSYDREQMDLFEEYRANRVDISLFAYQMASKETISFLINKLTEAVNKNNEYRTEAVLFLLEEVADFMGSVNADQINALIDLCGLIGSWCYGGRTEQCRLGKTLLRLLYNLSHLIITHNENKKLVERCLLIILFVMKNKFMIGDALDVLEKYIKDGVDLNIEMCKFTSRCYELFLNEQLPISVRLTAIKCIGYSLSNAEPSFVLQSLNTILAPRLQRLQGIVDGQCTSSSSSLEALEAECLFEISVFSSLMATLKIKIKSESDSNLNLSVDTESPALIVLQQSIPFFRDLIAKFSSSETLVDKVCDALRSGLAVVDRNYALIIKYYCEVIDEILLKHVDIVSNFAKSVILIFASTDVSSILFSSLVKWLEEINRTGESEIAEGYIDLIYHLIKKSWNLFLVDQNNSLSALENVVNIALKNLAKNPSNPLLTRKSAALLTILILKASDIFDELFQRNAQRIVTILFSQIKIEMIQATIESIAEALMVCYQKYPQLTRSYIAELPYGTSHFVAILKECYRKRQFKQLCIVFNQSVRKELQSG